MAALASLCSVLAFWTLHESTESAGEPSPWWNSTVTGYAMTTHGEMEALASAEVTLPSAIRELKRGGAHAFTD
jgi:hypothetical protein